MKEFLREILKIITANEEAYFTLIGGQEI